MSTTETGMAGEYHVLAQLCQRGYSAHPTLGNTKGMDILVASLETGRMLRVEVKTARNGWRRPSSRGARNRPYWQWLLSSRADHLDHPSLVYCFVHLGDAGSLPRFFWVPSHEVAEHTSSEHADWVNKVTDKKHRQKRLSTTTRNFWFYAKGSTYAENWGLIDRLLQEQT